MAPPFSSIGSKMRIPHIHLEVWVSRFYINSTFPSAKVMNTKGINRNRLDRILYNYVFSECGVCYREFAVTFTFNQVTL